MIIHLQPIIQYNSIKNITQQKSTRSNIKMMSNTTIKLKRLQKQQQSLITDPPANILVKRDGQLNFYFCIHGLEGEYKGGFYYGLLELHENYPFAAPKLYFYTPSGRFEINMAICTSFTNYHQESWTSAWNVRSLLLATVSFMTSHEASYGCRDDSNQIKQSFAHKSLQYNAKIPKFCQLFYQQLKQLKISEKTLNAMRRTLKLPEVQTLPSSLLQAQPDLTQVLNQNLNNRNLIQNQRQPQDLNRAANQHNQNERRNNIKKVILFFGMVIVFVGGVVWLVVR